MMKPSARMRGAFSTISGRDPARPSQIPAVSAATPAPEIGFRRSRFTVRAGGSTAGLAAGAAGGRGDASLPGTVQSMKVAVVAPCYRVADQVLGVPAGMPAPRLAGNAVLYSWCGS